MTHSSDEDPSIFSSSSAICDAATSDEDPTISYDFDKKYNNFEIFKRAPWISSKKWWILILQVYFVLCYLVSCYPPFYMIMYGKKGWDACAIMDLWSVCTSLDWMNIYIHTLIVCTHGIDRWYILTLFGKPLRDFVALLSIVIAGDFSSFLHILPIVYLVVSITTFVIWSIPTRILYVTTFRDTVKFFYMNENFVISNLICPLSVMYFIVTIYVIMYALGAHLLDDFTPGRLFTDAFTPQFLFLLYEIMMYVIINPSKNKFTHRMNFVKMNKYERIYMLMVGLHLFLTFAAITLILSNKCSGDTWATFQLINNIYRTFAQFRFILLWYYAKHELDMRTIVERTPSWKRNNIVMKRYYSTDATDNA